LFKEVVEQAYMDRLAQAAQQEKAIRYTTEEEGAPKRRSQHG
jgi:hypothetical protein